MVICGTNKNTCKSDTDSAVNTVRICIRPISSYFTTVVRHIVLQSSHDLASVRYSSILESALFCTYLHGIFTFLPVFLFWNFLFVLLRREIWSIYHNVTVSLCDQIRKLSWIKLWLFFHAHYTSFNLNSINFVVVFVVF